MTLKEAKKKQIEKYRKALEYSLDGELYLAEDLFWDGWGFPKNCAWCKYALAFPGSVDCSKCPVFISDGIRCDLDSTNDPVMCIVTQRKNAFLDGPDEFIPWVMARLIWTYGVE
jgi:hypothetical protein